MLMGARSTPVRWQEIYYPISSISNRSSLCMLNLSCAQNNFNACVSSSSKHTLPWNRHHGILLNKRAPFPAHGNAKLVPAKLSSAATPYSCCILLFLPFAPTIQHRDGPCAPSSGFVRGFARGGCRYFRCDCMECEHALGSFSFFEHLSFQGVLANTLSALLPITTPRAKASSLS